MVDSDSREVFVFYHVPKTGGISINHLLNEKLIRGVDFIDLGLAGQEDDAEHRPVTDRKAIAGGAE